MQVKFMKKTKFLVLSSVIAALYAAITMGFYVISYGAVQFRISEALTILPIFTPAAVPGLTVGCLIANIMGGNGPLDIVFGTLATLLAAIFTRKFRKKPLIAIFSPVLFNALIVGSLIYYIAPNEGALFLNMLTVGFGELVVCYAIGYPLVHFLKKYPKIFD